MKLNRSFPLLVFINIASLGIFFMPLFVEVKSESLEKFLAPVSVVLVLLTAVACLMLSHSRMTSRSLLTLSATACALGVLGKLLDLPAGGSGLFFVVIVCGFALGSEFGQLVGMSSMFVSALLTGGIGPWLGYQAIAMGLVGAAAGLASPLIVRSFTESGDINRFVFTSITIYAGVLGIVYGFLANWWSWPFLDYGDRLSFDASASIINNLGSYLNFYLRTSLWWDIWAFIGNVFAMIFLGRHVIAALLPARDFLNVEIEFVDNGKKADDEIYFGATS